MKKGIIILIFLYCIPTYGNQSLFNKANKKYEDKKYKTAISLYEDILKKGLESSELYYNIGNCYYKTEDWANAIWNYEKSLQIKRDDRTLENIKLTQSKITNKIAPKPKVFYNQWWDTVITYISTKHWQIATIICVWLILIIQIIRKLSTLKFKHSNFILIIFSISLSILSYSSYIKKNQKNQAIIMTLGLEINSNLNKNDNKKPFPIPIGSKVNIINTKGERLKIESENGLIGWIKKSDCKIL